VDCGGCLMVVRPSEACCPEPYPAEGLVRFGCIGGEAVSLSHEHHPTQGLPDPTSQLRAPHVVLFYSESARNLVAATGLLRIQKQKNPAFLQDRVQ
jgi:hypothetical protein